MLRNSLALAVYAASITFGVKAGTLAWTKVETKFMK